MKTVHTRLPYIASLAVVLSFSSLFLLIMSTAEQQHKLMEESAGKSLDRAISRELKIIQSVTKDFSWWDNTIKNTIVSPDINWVHNNLGWYIYDNFEIEYVALLNEELLPLYQFNKSHVKNTPLLLDGAVENILMEAQGSKYLPDSEGPKSITGIAFLQNKLMLLSASRLMQEGNSFQSDTFDKHVLVLGKELEGDLLEKLRYEINLESLDIVYEVNDEHGHLHGSFDVSNFNGDIVAHLHMEVPDPESGTSMAMYTALFVLGLSSILTLGIAFRTVRNLKDKYAAIDLLTKEANERKRAQEKLEAFKDQLKEEVDLRTTELKEEQQHLLSIFNASADGILTIDDKGVIQRLNPAAAQMFGYEENELSGKKLEILLCSTDRDSHQSYLDKSNLHAPRIINKTRSLWALHKSGEEFAIDLNVAPIKGGRKGFVGILRDISDRVELEKQREVAINELKNVIETTKEGFIKFSHLGVMESVNEAFANMMGYEQQRLIGTAFHDYVYNEDLEHFFIEKEVCDRLGENSCQLRIVTNKGIGTFDIKATKVIGSKGDPDSYFAFISDVTEIYNYQEELLKARNESDRANLAKSEFLSSMSHELRTPLNAIIGFAQLLVTSKRETLSDRQKVQVEHILNGGHHLLTLINDILDLSKIESGKMSLSIERVNSIVVINECLSFVKGLAEEKNVILSFEEDSVVNCDINTDHTRFKQALINLVNNAIKYNVDGGSVNVRLDVVEDNLKTIVSDTGIGIPNHLKNELFKPFSRLGNEGGEIEGTGIGLTLTKKLVLEMGGEIGFDSEEGLGSNFWLLFPLSDSPKKLVSDRNEGFSNEKNIDHPSIKPISKKAIVLYIEDNPANQDLMIQLFEEYPEVELLVENNAEDGIITALTREPKLVLMDINLPGMDGIEATYQLKSNSDTSQIPVIAVTANAMDSMKKKATKAGCEGYLTKPIQIDQVEHVISTYLRT